MKKIKERFTTPQGVAYFPYISKPDPNYGGYKVNLCVPKEEAMSVIAVIKNVLTQGIQMDKALSKAINNKHLSLLRMRLMKMVHLQVMLSSS